MGNSEKIQSPCIHVCTRDLNNICLGCFRSIEEIKSWWKFSEEEKLEVLKNTEQRRVKKEKDDEYAHYV